jgi:hypothetical protein
VRFKGLRAALRANDDGREVNHGSATESGIAVAVVATAIPRLRFAAKALSVARPQTRPRNELAEVFDDLDKLVGPVSVPPGELHERSRLGHDEASLWCACDPDPAAATEVE